MSFAICHIFIDMLSPLGSRSTISHISYVSYVLDIYCLFITVSIVNNTCLKAIDILQYIIKLYTSI